MSPFVLPYDEDGRLGTLVTSGPGTGQPTVTLTYGYDPSGDVTSIKDSLSGTGATGQGITTYVYDPALRLTTISQSFGGSAGPQIVDSYDSGGRLTASIRTIGGSGTSVSTSYGYDAANNLTSIEDYTSVLTTGTLDESFEKFDPAGQVTSITYNYGLSGNNYGYNSNSEVTDSSGSFNASYSYDLNGNPNGVGYTPGAGNELTNSPGVTYTFDNNGNTISATTTSGTTTYTYDYENRLTSVDQNGTVVATYTYNALGQRIGVDDSGTQTWTVYNGTSADANPYADFNGSGSVKMRYLFGPAVDAILARTDSSGNTAWGGWGQTKFLVFLQGGKAEGTLLLSIR